MTIAEIIKAVATSQTVSHNQRNCEGIAEGFDTLKQKVQIRWKSGRIEGKSSWVRIQLVSPV